MRGILSLPTLLVVTLALGAAAPPLAASERRASLRGSAESMMEQNRVAREHGLTFFRTAADIRAAVERGDLVRLEGSHTYEVADFVRLPYAVEAARTFVERLSAGYHEACGQKLVVTSAVRALTQQPRNAHALSVHPAGMALDIRVSDRASCRKYLEDAILDMERQGLLNGIREFNPPHYHIAVYPSEYLAWVEEMEVEEAVPAHASASLDVDAPEEAPLIGASPATGLPLAHEPAGGGGRARALLTVSAAALLTGVWLGLGQVTFRRPGVRP